MKTRVIPNPDPKDKGYKFILQTRRRWSPFWKTVQKGHVVKELEQRALEYKNL